MPTGQADLTEKEKSRLPLGNQHTKWNVVRWQAVKGAALYYGVSDWTSKVDSALSYGENISLMAREGTSVEANGGRTMKDIPRENR
jgi:hypothetical protein